MKSTLILILASVTIFSMANATSRLVPQDYATIQSALNACQAGDSILVAPGTYFENLLWPDLHGIKMMATGSYINTIVDGGKIGRVFSFDFDAPSKIDTITEITGFTIRHGDDHGQYTFNVVAGSAIFMINASPKFTSCKIDSCQLDGRNTSVLYAFGVIHNLFGSPVFRDVIITENRVVAESVIGGLIYCLVGRIELVDCQIIRNTVRANETLSGGLLYVLSGGDVVLNRMKIVNNTVWILGATTSINGVIINAQGGGVFIWTFTNCLIANNVIKRPATNFIFGGILYNAGITTITNSTFANNKIQYEGTGVVDKSINSSFLGSVKVVNSILWNGSNQLSTEISGSADVAYSDVRNGYIGTGNINANPEFISHTDFHLKNSSPCLNAGNNNEAPDTDIEGNSRPLPEGTNVDIGCYEINQDLRLYSVEYWELEEASLVIFPNPTSGELSFRFNLSQFNDELQIQISDALGRIVKDETIKSAPGMVEYKISIPDEVSGGVYSLGLTVRGKVYSKQFVVQR